MSGGGAACHVQQQLIRKENKVVSSSLSSPKGNWGPLTTAVLSVYIDNNLFLLISIGMVASLYL